MTLQTLTELRGWELENPEQDIRDRRLLGVSGRQVGVIEDLVVDLESERISAVVTDQGEAYATAGLEIRSDSVIAHHSPITAEEPRSRSRCGRPHPTATTPP